MQRRYKVRAYGPYKHGKRWRVHFVASGGGERTTHYETFDTRAAGEAAVEGARDESTGTTVSDAIDQFLAAKRAAGLQLVTTSTYEARLRVLLGPVARRPIRAVTGRGEELYLASTGARAADTHHNGLTIGKMWGAWCVRKRLLRANPFDGVEPVGRRVLGADKARLTVDESRQLDAWCRAHPDDPGAVLTLAYLLLGSRSSELTRRDVRDLDDDGRLLWIRATKTAAGRRRLRVPDELRVLLLALRGDRAPGEPLFLNEYGRRLDRKSARRHVRRVCEAAGVPVLSPQALRRTQSTLATEAGETALAVARHLGHATGTAPAVTHKHYIDRDSTESARVERAARAIKGDRWTHN